MNNNKHDEQRIRVKGARLVYSRDGPKYLSLNGSETQTDLKFPIVFYSPMKIGMAFKQCPPGAISGSVTSGAAVPINGTVMRILMPVWDCDQQIALGDIQADVHNAPEEVGDLVSRVTHEKIKNSQDLNPSISDLKRQVYNSLNPSAVIYSTDPQLQGQLSKALFNTGSLFTMFRERVHAEPVSALDCTVETLYDLMKHAADIEESNRRDPQYEKGHGLFFLIGNGGVEGSHCLTHNISRWNYFRELESKGLERYVSDPEALQDLLILMDGANDYDGAVVVGEDGRFKEGGTRVRLPDKLKGLYRGHNVDLRDGDAIKSFAGMGNQDVGTKHITAAGITLSAPCVALTLSAKDNILREFRGGRIERQYNSREGREYFPVKDGSAIKGVPAYVESQLEPAV